MAERLQLERDIRDGRLTVIALDRGPLRRYGVKKPITKASIARLDGLTYDRAYRAQLVSTTRSVTVFIRRNHFS